MSDKFEVINYDKNGHIIEDLSKVELPKDINDLIVRMLNKPKAA